MPSTATTINAVILVGGPSRGTRFRPLSMTNPGVPKPLFPIGGRPMIEHHISALSKLNVPGNGYAVKDVFIIGFYQEDVHGFAAFIKDIGQKYPSMSFKYLREFESLGTGGGLYHFRDQILRNSCDLFFVLHADLCSSFPLKEMVDFQLGLNDCLCTLLGTRVPKETANLYGSIVSQNNKILHFVLKPQAFLSDLISCGIYLFDHRVFDYMKDVIKGITGEVVQLELDVLSGLVEGGRCFVYEHKSFWRQIKTAGSVVPANQCYLSKLLQSAPNDMYKFSTIGNVYIHESAKIDPTACIGPNVSIGPNTVIHAGVRIANSLILDSVVIREFSCVLYSCVSFGSVIGKWCRVEGTPPYLTPSLNKNGIVWDLYHVPSGSDLLTDGIKNQSIVVLGDNVKVKDEVVIRNCIVLPHKELKKSSFNEILM